MKNLYWFEMKIGKEPYTGATPGENMVEAFKNCKKAIAPYRKGKRKITRLINIEML